MNVQDLHRSARDAAGLLKSLASPNRLLILCRLAQGEASVGEMERALGLRQSALSQQLALLRRQGLVATRRQAQTVYYRLEGDRALRIMAVLCELYGTPTEPAAFRPTAKGDVT